MKLNLSISTYLAAKSLARHRMVAATTVLGVAIGMTVVGAILIVDSNTVQEFGVEVVAPAEPVKAAGEVEAVSASMLPDITGISFVRTGRGDKAKMTLVPTQEGVGRAANQDLVSSLPAKGVEDYQTMRLAVRLASLLAFLVGATLVFYTMRYSVAARAREFSLLLCLGEFRVNLGVSMLIESLVLGGLGTLVGLGLAFPTAQLLLGLGISTTGQAPSGGFVIPWWELVAMGAISVTVAILGVLSPIRSLHKLEIAEVLQPRFMSHDIDERDFRSQGFGWLIPIALAATYVSVRPFLQSWLSVVQFFFLELFVATLLAVVVLWCVRPLLRCVLGMFERLLQPVFPLESQLTGRRIRLTSHKIAFSVAGVTLVFSFLTGLHDITRSLKHEIHTWAAQALTPYAYFERRFAGPMAEDELRSQVETRGLDFFRLSPLVGGPFPFRLINTSDLNPYLLARGRSPLTPDTVIVTPTLAARFGLQAGDVVEVETSTDLHRFEVIELTDDIGFYARNGRYVDLKSYALFSHKAPLFQGGFDSLVGAFAMARSVDAKRPYRRRSAETDLYPYYRLVKHGFGLGVWQKREIDKDFLIFDFILLMTVVLACVGVANNMLIQVRARDREISVLRTIGISRWQVTRLLLAEGLIIGVTGATLAVVLGNALGFLSVSFLDRFTLFQYEFLFSVPGTVAVIALAVITCSMAAIYPAIVAVRTVSAEALSYE